MSVEKLIQRFKNNSLLCLRLTNVLLACMQKLSLRTCKIKLAIHMNSKRYNVRTKRISCLLSHFVITPFILFLVNCGIFRGLVSVPVSPMNGSTFILNILFQLCETIKKLRRIIPYLSRKLYIRFIFYARFNYSFYLDE